MLSLAPVLVVVLGAGCAADEPPWVDPGPVCEEGGEADLVFAADTGLGLGGSFREDFVAQNLNSGLRIYGDCRYEVFHDTDNGVGLWLDVREGRLDEETAATWLADIGAPQWKDTPTSWHGGIYLWSVDFGEWYCAYCDDALAKAWVAFHEDALPALYDEASPVFVRAEVAFTEETGIRRDEWRAEASEIPEVPWDEWIATSLGDGTLYPDPVRVPAELVPSVVALRDAFIDEVRVPKNGWLADNPLVVDRDDIYNLYIRTYPSEAPTLLEPIPGWE